LSEGLNLTLHNVNAAAVPKVKHFKRAKSWYQDFTQVTVEE